MNAPARIPPSGLTPAAQAAISLADQYQVVSTSIGAYLVETKPLVDGRYGVQLVGHGAWIFEAVVRSRGEARHVHELTCEALRQGLGPHAPQAAVQAPPPASTVVWSIWCRDGEQEDIHGALYRTESGARHACADLQQRHPRMDWRVLPLEIAAEE